MSDLSETYNGAYYLRWAKHRQPYHAFAEAILEVFHPLAVADVGCGAGWLLEPLLWRQVACIGVEGSRAALDLMVPELRRCVHLHDLAVEPPIPQMRDYEFCVSIEVAEHIRPEFTEGFLDWVTCGRRLLMTAAIPGQGGVGHVNAQPPEYWISRLEARNWSYRPCESDLWRRAVQARTAACAVELRNAMFFVRGRPEGREGAHD